MITDRERLSACKMSVWNRMEMIRWVDRATKEEVQKTKNKIGTADRRAVINLLSGRKLKINVKCT